MYIQTKKDLVSGVCERWKYQYFISKGNQWMRTYAMPNCTDKEDAYKKLLDCKTEAEVVETIGNKSWTRNPCNECDDKGLDYNENDYESVIFLAATDEYGPVPFCKECIKKALDMFGAES